MSGHNKWSTIKHKKAKVDAKRGKIFTKLIREIVVATKEGGKDADGNPRLRSAMIAARSANMPNDKIDKAIKRGAGEIEGAIYEQCTYEGYGPGGVAYLIEVLTDNKNRAVAEIRHAFSKHGGNLGTDGSVAWMFEHKGTVEVTAEEGADFDDLYMEAAEAGADDVEAGDPNHCVYCEFTELNKVASALEGAGYTLASAKGSWIPTTPCPVEGKTVDSTMRLIDRFEENDDVQHVYTNADISDEEMERLANS